MNAAVAVTPVSVLANFMQVVVSGLHSNNTANILGSFPVCNSTIYITDLVLLPADSLQGIPQAPVTPHHERAGKLSSLMQSLFTVSASCRGAAGICFVLSEKQSEAKPCHAMQESVAHHCTPSAPARCTHCSARRRELWLRSQLSAASAPAASAAALQGLHRLQAQDTDSDTIGLTLVNSGSFFMETAHEL